MNRRWFLKALGAGVLATPALVEALAPRPTIFLPPRPRLIITSCRSRYDEILKPGPWNYSNELATQVELTEASFERLMQEILKFQPFRIRPTYIIPPRLA